MFSVTVQTDECLRGKVIKYTCKTQLITKRWKLMGMVNILGKEPWESVDASLSHHVKERED